MEVMDSYTACVAIFHLRHDFCLGLTTPTAEEIQMVKGQMQFKTAETDKDDDFLAKGGRIGTTGVLKTVKIAPSENKASIAAMSATTDQCFDALYRAFEILYSRAKSEVEKGLEYVDYETITRLKLSAPLYGIFSDTMKEQIAQWKDLSSGMLLNVVAEGASWKQKSTGVLDLSASMYELLYDGQQNALVMPSTIEFTISIPTNYHRLSHYKVAFVAQSIEDFQENIYFAKSEFPYSSHISIVQKIAGEG